VRPSPPRVVPPSRNEAEHADVRFLALPRSWCGFRNWRSRPRETRDGHLSRRASVYFRRDKSFSANRSTAIPLRTWRTCRRSGGPRADARDFASPRISMRQADIGARDRREAGCGGDRCVRAAVSSPSWPECNYLRLYIFRNEITETKFYVAAYSSSPNLDCGSRRGFVG